MSWATPARLRQLAEDLDTGAIVPQDDGDCIRLLERAQRSLEVHALGTRIIDLDALTETQTDALSRAACAQALWQLQLSDEQLGPDGIAGVSGLSFTRDTLPRLSPQALEEVVGYGLIARTPMAPTVD